MNAGVSIIIKHAKKQFGENVIIPDLSVTIKQGEFFTLLGSSGCGKTTLLRMIAGFNTIDGGEFFFDEKKINDMDPAKRNIGMVFQNYAIFPHLTVEKNVAFGLKNRKLPAAEIKQRTDRYLDLMQIAEYRDRMPERLSGGQQQRVALARALAIEPNVLLMDEPLSNLDAKLRVEMRTIIKAIQRRVGITTVYVTHDQEEAMAISDRIAVMSHGVIQHIGTPQSIYQRPANLFVATFIGRTNVFDGELLIKDGNAVVRFDNGYEVVMDNVRQEYKKSQKVKISVRPEEFLPDPEGAGMKATIQDLMFLGLNTNYTVNLENGVVAEMIRESDIDDQMAVGTAVTLTVNAKKINVFTEDGSENILLGVKDDNVKA